jgi:hypothetical protein
VRAAGPHGLEQEAAKGVDQLEGYLLLQADQHTARREATAFADRLPWLTTAQREEVVRLYAEERLALSVRVLRAVAQRCRELQGQYTERYEALQARISRRATACVVLCLSLALSTALLELTN